MCATPCAIFAKSPGFTLVVVPTLALGIGANTAVFQFLDAVRLRTLPIANPGELAELRIAGGNRGFGINDSQYANFTVPMWQEVKQHHDPFSGVFAWRTDDVPGGQSTAKPTVSTGSRSAEISSMCSASPLCRAV